MAFMMVLHSRPIFYDNEKNQLRAVTPLNGEAGRFVIPREFVIHVGLRSLSLETCTFINKESLTSSIIQMCIRDRLYTVRWKPL